MRVREKIQRALLWLLVLVPLVLGIIAGLLIRLLIIFARAVMQGYEIGMGNLNKGQT